VWALGEPTGGLARPLNVGESSGHSRGPAMLSLAITDNRRRILILTALVFAAMC
jgi:hypothetical protein